MPEYYVDVNNDTGMFFDTLEEAVAYYEQLKEEYGHEEGTKIAIHESKVIKMKITNGSSKR